VSYADVLSAEEIHRAMLDGKNLYRAGESAAECLTVSHKTPANNIYYRLEVIDLMRLVGFLTACADGMPRTKKSSDDVITDDR